MTNRLGRAASPYLRQHADNPVDWYEWSDEAFARARAEDKPVFLSIGYSSCHWCHVMAYESFDDEEVARVLNDRFVAVKVDREERPDIDRVYMAAVQALTGRGGWPVSVFMTPDGLPFFAGTYWPRDDRRGMPGFLRVLAGVDEAWREQRDRVLASGRRLAARLQTAQELEAAVGAVNDGVAEDAARACVAAWDRERGGFGYAPKFPHAMTIDFLLAYHLRTSDPYALAAAVHGLEAMSRGGIYDHVAGGFARYAVDRSWLVPHFEKMLCVNAILLRVYTHAWQVVSAYSSPGASGTPPRGPHRLGDLGLRFRRVARETANYLLREMRHPAGGFYAATDADSDGVEGKFYTWPAPEFDEIVASVGEAPFAWRRFFGVTDEGSFSDPDHPGLPPRTILHEAGARDECDADFNRRLQRVRAGLYARRRQRTPPGLDDQVLTSWNALLLGALAEAGAAFGEPRYVKAAVRCAQFLRRELVKRADAGRPALWHTWHQDHGATVSAYLEDVAYLAQALLLLYEADGDVAWFAWSRDLAADADERFAERDSGGAFTGAYFATAHDAEALLIRPKDLWDDATPAGASVMADVQLRLAELTGDEEHVRSAEQTLARFAGEAAHAPAGHSELLRSLERRLAGSQEVAIVGAADDPATAALRAVYHSRWRPGSVLAAGSAGSTEPPLLAGRDLVDGQPAAYVCRDFSCERPVTTPEELAALVDR